MTIYFRRRSEQTRKAVAIVIYLRGHRDLCLQILRGNYCLFQQAAADKCEALKLLEFLDCSSIYYFTIIIILATYPFCYSLSQICLN